jgi:hypothetical protein
MTISRKMWSQVSLTPAVKFAVVNLTLVSMT